MSRFFWLVSLAFLEDTLADLEGFLRTIKPRSGRSPATDGIRWVRRRRNRLRTLIRRYEAGRGLHPSPRPGRRERRPSFVTARRCLVRR
jgi:hypothetical protein